MGNWACRDLMDIYRGDDFSTSRQKWPGFWETCAFDKIILRRLEL